MDMNGVVARTLAILKVPIEESKAEIIVDPLPTVMADETQMVQVMQNLIANAIKFHGAGTAAESTSPPTKERRNGPLRSRTTASDLNMEYADKIFQMFQRLHTKSEYPGTGVGLAIAKKIVERHGGRIWVESDGHNDSTLYFTIPSTVNPG